MQTVEVAETLPPRAIVTIKDGRVVANSRDVAEAFGKLHKDVLRAIDNLDCSPDFTERNFAPCSVAHPTVPGRFDRSFDLTRDGFAFLVMGFTGAKAARFKEAYIQAFNAMEEELRRLGSPAVPAYDEDGMEIFGMALRKADLALRTISLAERLAGPEAGLNLWRHFKLPALKAVNRQQIASPPSDAGHSCLAHLLRSVAFKQNTVGDLLDMAFHDTPTAKLLKGYGIVAEAPGLPGFVAIATANAFLTDVFAETPWMGDWGRALAKLPSAKPGKSRINFGGSLSSVVLVPRDTILEHRYRRKAH